MQQNMYWDGKKYVKSKIPWQNGNAFRMGGYPHMDYGGIPPANTDVAVPYTANGMTQWQGQGIDFRATDLNAPQYPMMKKPLQMLMPQMPMGNDQMTYGNYGQGALSGAVGNGAAGDVFANAHGYKKGGWIQHAVNPAHKGYCTPMTKSTCTPHRKTLAMRFKHGDLHHQYGGSAMPRMDGGGNPWQTVYNPDAIQEQIYAQRENTQDVITQNSDIYGRPNITGTNPDGMTPMDNNIVPGQQAMQQPIQYAQQQRPGTGYKNLLGAGMIAAGYFADRKSQRGMQMQNMNNGMTTMNSMNPLGNRGDYTQTGMLRPNDRVPTIPGKFYPGYQMGGPMKKYKSGGTYSVDDNELKSLLAQGYDIEYLD